MRKNRIKLKFATVLILALATIFVKAQPCNPGFSYSLGLNGNITMTAGPVSYTNVIYNWYLNGTYFAGSVNDPTAACTATANGAQTISLNIVCPGTPSAPALCSSSTSSVISITVSPCLLSAGFTSSLMAGGVVDFTNTTTGTSSNVVYAWDFGDGSSFSNSVSPAHTFTANGNYTVTLTANNNYSPACVSTITTVVNVNSVCNLNPGFTYTANSNGGITFSNTSSGTSTNTSYQWNFGDGSNSSSAAPSYTYENSGTYTVTLHANDSTSMLFPCAGSTSQTIVITNTCIPSTSFTLIPGGTPQYWHAVVGNTTNVAAAEWSWGDSSPNSTGIVTSHTYASAGTYSVCLSVTLTCGATGTYCTSQYLNKTKAGGADMVYLNCLTQEMLETGIGSNSKENIALHVFPNPNNGEFNLSITGLNTPSAKVEVYNLIGEAVFEMKFDALNNQMTENIRMENVASGVYFVKINAGNEVYTKKVIVNK